MLTDQQVAEIEARADAATAGPWYWRCGSSKPTTLYGARTWVVMDAVRAGMQGATFRFLRDGLLWKASKFYLPRKGQEHNASFTSDIDHPDAQFIAHARLDVPALCRDWRALAAEVGRLREALKYRPTKEQLDAIHAALPSVLAPWREVARKHGYAMAFHGSFARDIDLSFMPWIGSPSTAEELISALILSVDFAICPEKTNPGEETLHGRRRWVILGAIPGPAYFDISVWPTRAALATNTTDAKEG